MKYRKCLWCGDMFWAFGVEKCCCEEHRNARAAEKHKLAASERKAREEKIRAKLMADWTAPRKCSTPHS